MRFYAPSKMQSVKDMPSMQQLKFRQDGQGSVAELRRKDLLSELEDKERQHAQKTRPSQFEGAGACLLLNKGSLQHLRRAGWLTFLQRSATKT